MWCGWVGSQLRAWQGAWPDYHLASPGHADPEMSPQHLAYAHLGEIVRQNKSLCVDLGSSSGPETKSLVNKTFNHCADV